MRVSFIIKSHLREDERELIGGASKNPYRLVKYISRLVTVPWLLYFQGGHSGNEAYKARCFSSWFLKLYLKTFFQNLISARAVWRAFKESDLVQCHHPHYGLCAAILRKYVFRTKLLVIKAHGTAMPELLANNYSGIKGLVLWLNAWAHLIHDRYVLAQADVVLCSSRYQENEMASVYGIARNRLRCIYNGFDPEYVRPPACVAGGLKSHKIFIFCGRVVPKKGIDYAIRLFQSVAGDDQEYRLKLLLGKSVDIEDANVYRRIRKAVEEDPRIEIKHNVSEPDLYRCFACASVGLVTSRNYESIPTVVIEMLAAGLPVFATYLWGVPEILPEAFGLTGRLDVDQERIRRFISAGVSAESEAIVQKVRAEFGYSVLVHEYLSLYESLINRRANLSAVG